VKISEDQILEWKDRIDGMTQIECAYLQRFSPSGHPIFDSRNKGLYEYFSSHFKMVGGMTPEIMEKIGW
jgi:hypothetical protein